MTEKEFRSYRLASLTDPTDEMLEMLMDRAIEEVRESNRKSKEIFFENLRKAVSSRRAALNSHRASLK